LLGNDYVANALGVTAGGAITQCNSTTISANDLTLTSTGAGSITQAGPAAKILINNDTYLSTLGDITLTNAGNDFCHDTSKNGTVNVNDGATLPSQFAHSASLKDATDIGIGNMNIANGLTLNANGYVAQKQTKKLNLIENTSTITAGKYITVYTANAGTSSSPATLKLFAGTINPDDVNLVAADIYGQLIVNAAHDINVIDVITGHTHDIFSFTANNDINIGTSTQLTPTSVITGGAAFTAAAGRSFNMIGNSAVNPTLIDTAGANINITANNVSGHAGIANIAMSGNTLINAGSGNVVMELLNTANANAGTITLRDITGSAITAWNQSLAPGTDVILNGALNATGTTANPLIVSSDGGNFTNTYGAGALVVDPTQRWLVYTGSPAETTLGGLVPVNTYYSTTIYTVPPTNVVPGNSVLYRTPNPGGGGGGGGGGGTDPAGPIVAGTVGGAAAAGATAGTISGLGLLPGLIIGLASPIQFDECMIDVIDQSKTSYPLLVRNMQYVFQTCDICKLDPCKIGSTKFIPDACINNGSYELVKVQIPAKFAKAPKGVTVKITQKSCPFGISKNTPDMNFNVFNTLCDKEINSMYTTRRFLKPNYLSKRIACIKNSKIDANNGIVQKTVLVKPCETGNNLSIAVNYLEGGQFPKKNCNCKLNKQTYALVVQFCENK